MKQLVEFIARHLVDHPDEVRVDEVDAGRTIIYELYVHPDDLGQVIGREGRTAQATRELMSVASCDWERRVRLDIVD